MQAEEIIPVAPPLDGEEDRPPVDAKIPADPSEVEFKGAGHETKPGKKSATAKAAAAAAKAAEPAKTEEPAKAAEASAVADKSTPPKTPSDTPASTKKKLNPVIAGGAALAVLALRGWWSMLGTLEQRTDARSLIGGSTGA